MNIIIRQTMQKLKIYAQYYSQSLGFPFFFRIFIVY